MSFCVHFEVAHWWVVVDDVRGENSPLSLRSGHLSSVLELVNLIISTGFVNFVHGDPVTAFADILEHVLDPTNTRLTELYIPVAVDHAHQLRVIRNISAQGFRARVSWLSHLLLMDSADGIICSARFQTAVSQIEKA